MWRLPPIGTGRRPHPRDPDCHVREPRADRSGGALACTPDLEAPPRGCEPGAPPRAQLEVLTDRIGTGLLLATVVGVIAAGLAAKPLVVVETEARERARRGASPPRHRPRVLRSCGETSRRQTPGGSPMATSAPASRTTTASPGPASSWTRGGADAGDRGPERDPELRSASRAESSRSAPAGSTSNTSTRLRPGAQRRLRHHHREVLAALPPQVEAAPDRADPPVHGHRHVAVLPEWHAAQRPGHARGEHGVARRHVLA